MTSRIRHARDGSKLATFRRQRDGQDGGCFEAALDCVHEFGGVLEHPAHSLAWARFELPRPYDGCWHRSLLLPGWVTEVDQRWYGHEMRKPTWLYYVGPNPVSLRWGRGRVSGRTIQNTYGGAYSATMNSRTPPAFRDVLLDIARSVGLRGRRPDPVARR